MQSSFPFIPTVLSGIEVRVLCRPLEILDSSNGLRFMHRGIVVLENGLGYLNKLLMTLKTLNFVATVCEGSNIGLMLRCPYAFGQKVYMRQYY